MANVIIQVDETIVLNIIKAAIRRGIAIVLDDSVLDLDALAEIALTQIVELSERPNNSGMD